MGLINAQKISRGDIIVIRLPKVVLGIRRSELLQGHRGDGITASRLIKEVLVSRDCGGF